eukprot:gene3959-14038_t
MLLAWLPRPTTRICSLLHNPEGWTHIPELSAELLMKGMVEADAAGMAARGYDSHMLAAANA